MANSQPVFFSKKRIYLVLGLCLGISGYFIWSEIGKTNFSVSHLTWNFNTFLFLFIALVAMAGRDAFYIIRLKVLAAKELSWNQCIRSIFMWEFASAISPGVVGGSAVAMFILKREGIPLGKSTALVIITAIMDNFFYIILLPLLFLFIPLNSLFPESNSWVVEGGKFIFWTGYLIVGAINLLLMTSVFFYPKLVGIILAFIHKLPFLRKRKEKAAKFSHDIVLASKEIKKHPLKFWLKIFIITCAAWISRYLVINFMLLAFVELNLLDHLYILGRQMVMWMVMLVTPTPGGSGAAEYLFSDFLADFTKGGALASGLAILWRILSYYPYLLIGTILTPRWLAITQKQKKENN